MIYQMKENPSPSHPGTKAILESLEEVIVGRIIIGITGGREVEIATLDGTLDPCLAVEKEDATTRGIAMIVKDTVTQERGVEAGVAVTVEDELFLIGTEIVEIVNTTSASNNDLVYSIVMHAYMFFIMAFARAT